MFLFFHGIGFPWWAALAMLMIIVFCFLLTIRGFYVLITLTPKQTLIYFGIVFSIFSIICITFFLTKSDILQIICVCFCFPFGFFAGLPFLLFVELPEPLMYLGAAFLNLVAICGVIEFIERFINSKRLK